MDGVECTCPIIDSLEKFEILFLKVFQYIFGKFAQKLEYPNKEVF